MTNNEVKAIAKEVETAFNEIAKKYGLLSFKITGNIKVDGTAQSISEFRLSATAIVTAAKVDANLIALGLPAGSLGKVIQYGGKPYEITGANMQRPKYGVAATDLATGKSYCLVTDRVIQIIGKAAN